MTTANDREREISERLAAATPGEWYWKPFRNSTLLFEELRSRGNGTILTTVYGSENVGDVISVAPADRDLIFYATADLRYLLDTVRELRDRVAELTRERDAAVTALAVSEADYRAVAAQVARIDRAGDVQIGDLEVSYGMKCDMSKVRLCALMAVTTLDCIRKRRAAEAQTAVIAATGNEGAE